MRYELVIFDMDGTLADTSPCIFETYRYISREFGMGECPEDILKRTLENSLTSNLRDLLHIPESRLQSAADGCMEFYTNSGYRAARLYDGVMECVETIRGRGQRIGLATLSHQDVAEEMLEAWGLADAFLTVHGSDPDDATPKSALIRMCLEDAGVDAGDAVMIGDSMGDYRAARDCRVDFIAASYGYNLPEGFCRDNGIPCAEKPCHIPEMV
ncbi:MAG: HAD family hydrolase [Candidatus Methanomethylophilaceae archaeon]|nr:HAD family hydrolase [Candidatus Methanomethylophilaceae archaeon]